MTALTEWQRYLCILVWYSSQLRDPLAQHLRIWLSSFFSCLVLWPIYWSEVRYGYSIFCNGFSAPDTITLRQCWKGKNKHERRFHILVQLTVASVHLAGISVKVSSTALSKVICLVSFLMAQVTLNFKMSSGVKNWKSRWWLNENQLSGKFKLFIFLFCFNRTHHNIFPDDFTVDQLTILPENIEKINWVLQRFSFPLGKRHDMGTIMLILSFKRKIIGDYCIMFASLSNFLTLILLLSFFNYKSFS